MGNSKSSIKTVPDKSERRKSSVGRVVHLDKQSDIQNKRDIQESLKIQEPVNDKTKELINIHNNLITENEDQEKIEEMMMNQIKNKNTDKL
ncbi:unnamed protein product [Moneuplotes crassus]|uniref:Uncharacterized protein n=1 Tax=Euplotes crassus TaxID=5936 RepID=A0AAD1XH20_EUPCR|nr:unnamed protein product [Moneuplotes crassus]